MENKLENGELAYFNDAPWLVTNKRICSPAGVFRLSDVRSAELVVNESALNLSVWIYRIGCICATAGMLGGCILGQSNGDSDLEVLFVMALFAVPGLVILFSVKKLTAIKASLNLHCSSGVHTLVTGSCEAYEKGVSITEIDKMRKIKKAIGDALAAG